MEMKTELKLLVTLIASLSLGACNIEEEAIDQKKEEARKTVTDEIKKTYTGVITDLETLKVNDVVFDTENTKVYVDGKEVDYSELELGMVVTVSGTDKQDGTGYALSVDYDKQLSGIVVSNNFDVDGTIKVMGQTVYINSDTVIDSDDGSTVNIDDIMADFVVEVSGYTDGDGEVWATRIEISQINDTEEEFEVEGKINSSSDANFMIGELSVVYEPLDFPQSLVSQLVDGAYVEVKSIDGYDSNDNLIAYEIEIEHANGKSFEYENDDDELDIEGVVTNIVSNNEMEVNGTTVYLDDDVSSEIDVSSISIGDRVEIEVEVDENGEFTIISFDDENDSDKDQSNENDNNDTDNDSIKDDDDSDDDDSEDNDSDNDDSDDDDSDDDDSDDDD